MSKTRRTPTLEDRRKRALGSRNKPTMTDFFYKQMEFIETAPSAEERQTRTQIAANASRALLVDQLTKHPPSAYRRQLPQGSLHLPEKMLPDSPKKRTDLSNTSSLSEETEESGFSSPSKNSSHASLSSDSYEGEQASSESDEPLSAGGTSPPSRANGKQTLSIKTDKGHSTPSSAVELSEEALPPSPERIHRTETEEEKKIDEARLNRKKRLKDIYGTLIKSATGFIHKHTQESKNQHYLAAYTRDNTEVHAQGATSSLIQCLHTIATSLHNEEDEHNKRIALPTFCMTKVISMSASKKNISYSLHQLYFCKAISGAGDSHPAKRGALQKLMIIAIIVIIASLFAGLIISLGYAALYIYGIKTALSTSFFTLLQQGYLQLPYKFLIPTISSLINQRLFSYFFGKSSIQEKIDLFDKSIPTSEIQAYPDSFTSLQVLRDFIDQLTDKNLKTPFNALHTQIKKEIGEASDVDNKDDIKKLHFMPILFAANTLLCLLPRDKSNESDEVLNELSTEMTQLLATLSNQEKDKLIALCFYALKGAGFTKPPREGFWKKFLGHLERIVPLIVVAVLATACATLFCVSSFHAFFIVNIVISFLALLPKDILPDKYQEIANRFFQNGIPKAISDIEDVLTPLIGQAFEPPKAENAECMSTGRVAGHLNETLPKRTLDASRSPLRPTPNPSDSPPKTKHLSSSPTFGPSAGRFSAKSSDVDTLCRSRYSRPEGGKNGDTAPHPPPVPSTSCRLPQNSFSSTTAV